MKLLFDENLAARLAVELSDLYPDSSDVKTLSLHGMSDKAIWDVAGKEGYVLVTKDEDFHRLSVLYGPPPKVVWIRLGNCTTDDVRDLLRASADEIEAFEQDLEAAFLALG